MPFNPNIHHRRSIRLKGYDYSQAGLYYIIICCHRREQLFGNIMGDKMFLNEAGKIAAKCWMEIPDHFPNVMLHEYIIMPNHIHGIIELKIDKSNIPIVGVQNFEPLQLESLHQEHLESYIFKRNEFQKIIPRSIGSIIRGFKIGVTKWFRKHSNIYTVWQRNYNESIIWDEESYKTVSHYIKNNPKNWEDDKFNI